MTLIAFTLNNACPVLMGDILISSRYSDGDIETPTYVQGTGEMFVDKKGSRPLALNQKLYVINDRLCVALGGNLARMETFLKRLRALFGNTDFENVKLLNYVDNYPSEDKEGLLAIVVFLKSELVNGKIDFALRTIGAFFASESERYGLVVAGGSGDQQFMDFINSDPNFYTDITNSDGNLVLNQYLISYWLGREVSRADSLSNNWGACYEMIIFEKGRFVKLEEYTVVLLEGKFGKDIPFEPGPFNTIMVHYQDDVMIIRAFARNIEKTFAVPTILDERDQIYLKYKEPKHETLLITYLVDDVDNNMEYFPTIVRPRNINKEGESPIVFEFVGSKLILKTDRRLDQHVLEMIMNIRSESGKAV